ncbi:Crp/Fnr family transcriptional regulator [Gluconobacter sp. OJA]
METVSIFSKIEQAFYSTGIINNVSEHARQELYKNSKIEKYCFGSFVFRCREESKSLFWILKGTVHLCMKKKTGSMISITAASSGSFLLPADVVIQKPYLMDSFCVSDVLVLRIDSAVVRSLLINESKFSLDFFQKISSQSRENTRLLGRSSSQTAAQRFASYVIRQINLQHRRDLIILPYSKALIAAELRIKPESLSRIISELRKTMINVKGSTIIIHDYQGLINFSRKEIPNWDEE